ncbi:AI-2E family transporter [Alkalilimnicola sp. S0819]|uniref:AI-2E family transporter n=1 Tax=Alkalilimnicola sp. S0819 TaxID=2613922 RepID=UPI0012622E8C|nr:AI-2E family transporter [Alkalilimnicola sp. S0819]KAB7628306.1 AI-2E family transporter [Alkalilimnicola sp. S0819]MPQ15204.1 AI-2E family transporter [Alkalilimnicola sp. S0819]
MQLIRDWFSRHLNDPQVVGLGALLLVGFGVIVLFGNMLAPVLASIVLAYLLEGLVRRLQRLGAPRWVAVLLVFALFICGMLLVVFSLIPMLTAQLAQLVEGLPRIIAQGQEALRGLARNYPAMLSEQEVQSLLAVVREELALLGQQLLSLFSFRSLVALLTLVVYLVLMPLLVFFFLKDKDRILQWFAGFLPRDRALAARVWREVNVQMGNYVRGKFLEILIVWLVTLLTFTWLELQFAMLLAVVVGLSVIIPYIGATVVTLPVAAVAYAQFGASPEFLWVLAAYGIIQALDGNVLVPLLFSGVVNLHPVAIIVAILVFGGIWGFWGIFFAIPLATLIQAVIEAWPREPVREEAT